MLAREVDLPDEVFGDAVQKVFLAADVVVERHRADLEVIREAPHGHGLKPLAVEQRERLGEHVFSGERAVPRPARRSRQITPLRHRGIPDLLHLSHIHCRYTMYVSSVNRRNRRALAMVLILQVTTVFLVSIAWAQALAHALELPGKLRLDK